MSFRDEIGWELWLGLTIIVGLAILLLRWSMMELIS